MARRVFFSFHYERDIRRVVQVRNSWVVRAKGETQPFLDKAEWESIKRTGPTEIERWIEKQMEGTSVTVVLFGRETFNRDWVKHEIRRSYELGKGIVAVDIHQIKDPKAGADLPGQNPLLHWNAKQVSGSVPFTELYKTYNWVSDDGYNNLSSWIEAAAKAVGR